MMSLSKIFQNIKSALYDILNLYPNDNTNLDKLEELYRNQYLNDIANLDKFKEYYRYQYLNYRDKMYKYYSMVINLHNFTPEPVKRCMYNGTTYYLNNNTKILNDDELEQKSKYFIFDPKCDYYDPKFVKMIETIFPQALYNFEQKFKNIYVFSDLRLLDLEQLEITESIIVSKHPTINDDLFDSYFYEINEVVREKYCTYVNEKIKNYLKETQMEIPEINVDVVSKINVDHDNVENKSSYNPTLKFNVGTTKANDGKTYITSLNINVDFVIFDTM